MKAYQNKPFTILSFLKGASRITEELLALLRNYCELGFLDYDLKYEFIKCSSYVDDKSGELVI